MILARHHKRTLWFGSAIALTLCAGAAAVIVRGIRETSAVTLRRVDVPLERLPAAFDGYRILLLSCLHLRGAGATERAAARLLQPEAFDLAVVAGDIRRSDGTLEETASGLDVLLPAIHARDGIYACPGNHDTPLTLRLARDHGIVELIRTAIPLRRAGETVWLGGAVDTTAATPDAVIAFTAAPPGAFRILIAHNPDAAAAASRSGVSLVLCGDTHGGQVRLPIVGALVPKTTIGRRFVYGLNDFGPTRVYTNPGLGTTGIRFRLGSPPELTVLTLRLAKSGARG